MKIPQDTHQKMLSAFQLLQGDVLSVSTFENVRQILKGVHPEVDKKLEIASKALSKLQKLQSGDIITLSVEGLSEDTEEKKKRKKFLLFFIGSIKDLRSEINRVNSEYVKANKTGSSFHNNVSLFGKIVSGAKGPFGIITLAAILIVVATVFTKAHKQNTAVVANITKITPSPSKVLQVLVYQGKQIPLSQFYIGHGSDCPYFHYHAISGTVTALDGTKFQDPEGCGFGSVKDMQVLTLDQ